jgi:hypothetical protein
MWQKELEKLQYKSLIKGQEITGMPFVTGTSDKVGDMVSTMIDIEAIIRGKLAEIQMQRKRIIEYIDSIESSTDRQVVFLYCVSNLNFYQIAKEMGPGYTYDCVRQSYYRRLKKDNIK